MQPASSPAVFLQQSCRRIGFAFNRIRRAACKLRSERFQKGERQRLAVPQCADSIARELSLANLGEFETQDLSR